jgi:hypothetical protein
VAARLAGPAVVLFAEGAGAGVAAQLWGRVGASARATARIGSFQMRTLLKVASEMALHVLAYNMKRVMQILGVCGLMAAMRA